MCLFQYKNERLFCFLQKPAVNFIKLLLKIHTWHWYWPRWVGQGRDCSPPTHQVNSRPSSAMFLCKGQNIWRSFPISSSTYPWHAVVGWLILTQKNIKKKKIFFWYLNALSKFFHNQIFSIRPISLFENTSICSKREISSCKVNSKR